MSGRPETRLAAYGSLAPGRSNHNQLSGLAGSWLPGRVRGTVIQIDSGPDAGYPALIPDPDGPEVEVLVLESAELGEHWDRLDAFEGPGYARVVVDVATAHGVLLAYAYVLAD